jgi:exopolyphosphatase/guanosine-5'-triphosphate,3'-diphosphate pyrophosphatase
MPDARHPEYMALTRLERMLVCKLAALLRVADALDRGHRQAARHLALERREDEFIITVHDPGDISLERGGLPEKADLFESVFGMKVSLRQAVGGTARVT